MAATHFRNASPLYVTLRSTVCAGRTVLERALDAISALSGNGAQGHLLGGTGKHHP